VRNAVLTGIADTLRRLGGGTVAAIGWLGYATRFGFAVVLETPAAFARLSLTLREIYFAGVLSLVIILVSGLFVGMVLALQGYDVLQRYGAAESLGVLVALSLVRELGPVVTALLFAGRAGTSLASELGLMRATDQLSAMEMMAVDPIARVVVPRFLGGVITMPLLAAIFSLIGIYGAQLVGVQIMGVDSGSFWSQMRAGVDLKDVNEGIVKSCIFGVACSLIAVYEGYYAVPTAEGVGRATTRTVVTSAVVVLFLDYLLTSAFL
jgi:phospholipid/cholesterol/gamma-HCH transport system permease protein